MAGKTTVARMIASRLQYACLGTDDIGVALTVATQATTHPAFHCMDGVDYRAYYLERDDATLAREADALHERMWPALQAIIRNHADWGSPLVIEGWALRPRFVAHLTGDVAGVFLVADDALLEARARSDNFSRGATDPEQMIRRFVARSLGYNHMLREETARSGLRVVRVAVNMRAEEIADACLRLLARES